MNDTPRPAAVSDSERIALIVAGTAVIAAGVPLLALQTAQQWLLDRGVLVPAVADPVWLLPGGQAGLDWPRLLIAAGALTAVLALLVGDRRRRRNQDQEAWR